MARGIHEIALETRRAVEFIDITGRVREAVRKSGVAEGLVTIFTRHTTTAVRINERCERLQEDMLALLERAVPAARYRHDEETVDGRGNARGHLMSFLLGASASVPLAKGELQLGTWQSIFFVELDGPRPDRGVLVSVVGDGVP